jgi:sigma-B regulation protein RsbU (phosphoserine phosphatase)
MRRLIEATGGGTWELDLCTGRVTADSMLRALHGFPPEGEFDLEAAILRVHPGDQQTIRTALEAAHDVNGSHRYHVQYRNVVVGGEPRWLEARGRIYFDPTGAPVRLLGTAVDITARMAAQQAREGLLAALAAQPFLQVCVLEGADNVVMLANAEYLAKVAGGRDIVGRPVLDSFPHLADQGFAALMKAVRDTGEPFIGHEVATRLTLDDGEVHERYFNFVLQPVMGAQGHVASLLNISHDVTDVVLARSELERGAAQDRARVGFERQLIGIVSHDLRTPLAVIGLGVDLLLSNHDSLTPISLRAVLRIQTTLARMVGLVNDLLDFTQVRIGTGMPIVLAPMSLYRVVFQTVEELRMRFPDRELVLDVANDTDGLWDAARLEQVAHNLITNALRYSPPTTPVHVILRADAARVELEIVNRGAPIEPDLLARLFEPMVRGSAVTPSGRSVGLGLFIVKHIVDSLGGTITVTSHVEEGTSFTVALPRARAAATG